MLYIVYVLLYVFDQSTGFFSRFLSLNLRNINFAGQTGYFYTVRSCFIIRSTMNFIRSGILFAILGRGPSAFPIGKISMANP